MALLAFFLLSFLVLCQVHAGLSANNLLPQWQFGNVSGWRRFPASIKSVEWTDGTSVSAATCLEENHIGCYNCWSVSDFIKIDPKKGYEFTIYIKTTSKDMDNYFGFFAYDDNKRKISGNWRNPYFKKGDCDPNRWKRWKGYILPHNMLHGDNLEERSQSFHTNGKDWIWPKLASYVSIRFGSCYGKEDDHRGTAWFVYPSVTEITPRLLQTYFTSDSRVRTFDISEPREWAGAPNYSGIAFVNGYHTPIARSDELDKSCYYPWGVTRHFQIDHKKMYEFSVWILSTGRDLHNFLGFLVYDCDYKLINATTATTDIAVMKVTEKPYFKQSANDTAEWKRWNGFVLPHKYDHKHPSPTEIPMHFRNGKETFKWPPYAKFVQMRFGTCYGDGDGKGKTYFAIPQVVVSDLMP